MKPEECREIFEMLSEYLDGELPVGTCQQIEQHIADCPPCIEFVESLRKSMKLYRGYTPPGRPAPLSGEAKQKLAEAYRAMLARAARGDGHDATSISQPQPGRSGGRV